MKTFIICEKAGAGRDVATFLSQKFGLSTTVDKQLSNFIHVGDEYTVGWCRGHLLALVEAAEYNPAWKNWNKDDLPLVPEKFKLEPAKSKTLVGGRYETKEDKGILDLLKSIKTCFTKAQTIINAGDCGREGQVIVDEVLEHFGFLNSKKDIKRLWVNGLNYQELDKGFNNLTDNINYLGMYKAGVVRAKTDWLFGINLTRAISINFKENGINDLFSAGRVQTPVITMIYERDKTIKNFKEKDFYGLSLILTNGKESLSAELVKNDKIPENVLDEEERIIDKKFIESLKEKVLNIGGGKIKSVTKKAKDVAHNKLYSLSTLQQECNSIYKISAAQTLEIAQKLYEKAKMISYPRTSSNFLPKSQFDEIDDRLNILSKNQDYKKTIDLLNGKYFKSKGWDDSKVSDHHAIIPIDFKVSVYNNQLSELERKVFDLIVKRYLSHLFPLKKEMEIKAIAQIGDYEFSSNSKYVIDSGWTVVYDKEVGGSEIKMQEGEAVNISSANVNNKKTTPPSKFTEGTLIAAMTNISKYLPTDNLTEAELATFKNILNKSEGIGTEATRAPLIEMLKARDFITLKNNNLDITNKGIELIENLYKINMHVICSPITTAKYELMLKDIEEGKIDESKFMADFLPNLSSWINIVKLNKFSTTHAIGVPKKTIKKTGGKK